MHTALIAILAAAGSNALFVWWGRTAFVPLGVVVVGGLLLTSLLGVLAAIIYAFSRGRITPDIRLTLRALAIGMVFFASTMFGLPVVKRLIERDVARARQEAESLGDRLEAYRQQHGLYPSSLEAVSDDQTLPALLTRRDAYVSTGTGYVVRLRVPGQHLAVEVYRSGDRRWRWE